MSIAIIDYGMGNLRSVEKALQHVGSERAFITSDPAQIESADKAVLPGDGAFDATVLSLRDSGIEGIVKSFALSGRPLLGICIGMQAFLTQSEEGEQGVIGLDLIPGLVKRFPSIAASGEKLPVPQIGWNMLFTSGPSVLLAGLPEESWIYCLHSYYCEPDESAVSVGEVDYGLRYCAVAEKGNIYATQFHPEKSGDAGLQILRNFVAL
jgi:glutamine amidotransferase